MLRRLQVCLFSHFQFLLQLPAGEREPDLAEWDVPFTNVLSRNIPIHPKVLDT